MSSQPALDFCETTVPGQKSGWRRREQTLVEENIEAMFRACVSGLEEIAFEECEVVRIRAPNIDANAVVDVTIASIDKDGESRVVGQIEFVGSGIAICGFIL